MWSISLITPPTSEPLALELEVRSHLRLDSGLTSQDQLLDSAISMAREECEGYTGRQLVTATLELWMSEWCESGIYRCGALWLPKPPLQSVSSIKYLDPAGVEQTWATDQYVVNAPVGPTAPPASIVPAYAVPWPILYPHPQAVKIRFVAGYSATNPLPAALRQGMLQRVGEAYERREEQTVGNIVAANAVTAERLWWRYRVTW